MNRNQVEFSQWDQMLRRLVDRELSASEIQSALRVAEGDPARYREIALAFVEEQMFSAMVPGTCFGDVKNVEEPGRGFVASEDHSVAPSNPTNSVRDPLMSNWFIGVMATAACLIAACSFWFGQRSATGTGRLAGQGNEFVAGHSGQTISDRSDSFGQDLVAKEDSSAAIENAVDDSQIANLDADSGSFGGSQSTLRLVKQTSSGQQFVDLPVVELPSVTQDQLIGQREAWLAELHREMSRLGYKLDVESTVFDSQLEDGRKVLLPIQDVRFTPIGY